MKNSTQPIFCLGIGAQKAGTTWLYNYLDHFNSVYMGKLKEYHVWDAIYRLDASGATLQKPKEGFLLGFLNTFKELTGQAVKTRIRYKFRNNPDSYFDYFESILKDRRTNLTGDITPSYAGLPVQGYERIKASFEARGIEVRVVFLMRDPVNRCWSAIRMFKRNGNDKFFNLKLSDDEALSVYLGSEHANLRCEYHKTLENVYKVFEPKNVYVGLYENMFEPKNIANLSTFLGLPSDQDFVQKKFNVGNRSSGPSPEVARKAQNQYAAVYEHCKREFPETIQLWRDFQA